MHFNFQRLFLIVFFYALWCFAAEWADTVKNSIVSASSVDTPQSDAFDTLAVSAAPRLAGKKIVAISFNGNRTTKEKILRLFLQSMDIDTGSLYDSTKIAYAKQKLRLTNYYSKVDILPLLLNDGVHLYVVLHEVFYINFDGVGGSWETRKHGDTVNWYRLNLGMTLNNFRGTMETFSIGAMVWDDRYLSFSWTKPLYPSPFFFSFSALAAHINDINFPQNRTILSGRFTLGRRLTLHSQGGIGVAPTFTTVQALDGATITKFQEIISSLRLAVDFRNDSYDPIHGWNLVTALSTNAAFADGVPKYSQLATDGRWYAHVFFKNDRLAFHTQTIFRTHDAGDYKRLYLGGDGSVRGFPSSWLGTLDTMNNLASISSEYRFHLYTTPVFDFGFLTSRIQELQGLYYELDGALIADAGHLWHDALRPLDRRQNGAGIGVGLNIKAPTLRLTGCIDVVWPLAKQSNPAYSYYNRTVIFNPPTLHLFVSTF